MFEKLNLYKPDRIIRLSELNGSGEIYGIMGKLAARDYAYGIAYVPNDELRVLYLKIGKSSPSKDRVHENQLGERIARQVGHLEGWPGQKPISANGIDFMMGLKQLVLNGDMSERALDRKNIIVGIWNTNPMFRKCMVDATPSEQAAWLEASLRKQYKIEFKDTLPPLNKLDPANGTILKRTWQDKNIEPEIFNFD